MPSTTRSTERSSFTINPFVPRRPQSSEKSFELSSGGENAPFSFAGDNVQLEQPVEEPASEERSRQMPSCWDSCLTVDEEETEWRQLPLRFRDNCDPGESQLGAQNNTITTSKYTLLSWIPKGTFEQFRRLANVYFLIISIMMSA